MQLLAEVVPRRLRDILQQVQAGRFDVHLDHRGLEPSVNRLVLGMLTSALFLGSVAAGDQSCLATVRYFRPRHGGISLEWHAGTAACCVRSASRGAWTGENSLIPVTTSQSP